MVRVGRVELDRNMDMQLNIHIGIVAGIVELAEFVVGRNTVLPLV